MFHRSNPAIFSFFGNIYSEVDILFMIKAIKYYFKGLSLSTDWYSIETLRG